MIGKGMKRGFDNVGGWFNRSDFIDRQKVDMELTPVNLSSVVPRLSVILQDGRALGGECQEINNRIFVWIPGLVFFLALAAAVE